MRIRGGAVQVTGGSPRKHGLNLTKGEDKVRADIIAVFFVSAGVLTFEVVLTRVFALTYWHHFASLLISLALTGFGAAGSLLALVLPRLSGRPRAALFMTAWLAAWAMPGGYVLSLAVGLEPLALAWVSGAWLDLALVCLILVIPFLLSAAHIGLVLAWAERPARAYAANLCGSAFGCLIAAGALAWLPPHQTIYIAALLTLAGAAACLSGLPRGWTWFWSGTLTAGLILVLIMPLPLRFEAFKDRSAVLAARGSRVEERVVGLRGLVEVIGGPAFRFAPGLSLSCRESLPEQRGLFIDGDLAGPITRIKTGGGRPGFLNCLLLAVPWNVWQPERVLVLNPGGGLSLLVAAQGNSRVTGVEGNPQIYGLMTGAWSDYNGELYSRPGLNVIREEPDIYLDRTAGRYDLIVFGDGGAWFAGAGLGVTRMLTVEDLGRMLERLTEGGVLVMCGPLMTPPRASIKLFATAAAALERAGEKASPALAWLRDWNTVLLLVKPSGFTIREKTRLLRAAHSQGFDLSYLSGLDPKERNQFHILPDEPLNRAAGAILSGGTDDYFDRAFFNLKPATRDRPYFFHFFNYRTLDLLLGHQAGRPLAASEWGSLFNWGGLVSAIVLAVGGILLPLVRLRPAPSGLSFFAFIGLGYMVAEIALLHEVIYALGRPSLAVPLVIGVFLLLSGLGSRLWGEKMPRLFVLTAALILPVTLPAVRYSPSTPWLVGLILTPAALVMGAPFAGGLTNLIGARPQARAWAFAVNGFCSVVGALAAGVLVMTVGHLMTVAVAAGCYLLAGTYRQGGGS